MSLTIEKYTYRDGLESQRLGTRFLKPEDATSWQEFMNDPRATEFFPASFFPEDIAPASFWIDSQLARYSSKRFGLQALVKKDTGEFVGQCGLLLQEVDGLQELEVGYHILPRYWGKGYAPEAAKLFIHHVFEQQLSDSVISIIDARNIKSQRVAEKNKLILDKKTNWRSIEAFIYRINAPSNDSRVLK